MIELHEGLSTLDSNHSVDDTVTRLQQFLREHNLKVFALIDHTAEAANIGLELRPTKLLIFGAPQAGTPLMQSVQTVAIDLPLKALVWEDPNGAVHVTYNTAEYLRGRHGFPAEFDKNIVPAATLLQKAAE